jgi:serine protease Do
VEPGSFSEAERGPCPRCGESTALAGRVCPHCDGSLLVDVVAASPVLDPRARYRVARELAAISPGGLTRLRKDLEGAGGVLLHAVTRDVARRALAVLEAGGVTGREVAAAFFAAPADVPELGRRLRGGGLPIPAVLAGIAVSALAVVLLVRRSAPAPHPALDAVSPAPAAASPSTSTPQPSTRETAARALESMAGLRCGSLAGAGFFVTPELLLTNAHVLCADRSSLEVILHDGRRLPGTVQTSDEWLDVAVVRVLGAAARPIPLGDATKVEPGDTVLFIGSPLGMDFSVARAIVSHPRRNMFGIAFVQFDANVNPGNSGGPLLDGRGRAVGIVSMMLADSRGIAFALPVNYLPDLPSAALPVADPPPDFDAWRRILADVRRQDALEAAAAREALKRPGLGGAAVDPDGHLYAIVVTLGRPAGSRPYRFEVARGGRVLCQPNGLVENWGLVSGRGGGGARDPRLLRWLSKIDLGTDVYSGSALLTTDGCPEVSSLIGAELALSGADPAAGRTVIDAVRVVN